MDLPDFSHAPILAFFAVFAAVFGLAFRFGGGPEKWGAVTLLAMPVTQLVLYSTISADVYGSLDWVALTVDVIGLVGFSIIALRAYHNTWPTLAVAMTVISSVAHFARINTDMLGFSYAQFKTVPTAVLILLVLVGTIMRQVRLRRDGKVRDWLPREYGYFRRLPEKLDEI